VTFSREDSSVRGSNPAWALAEKLREEGAGRDGAAVLAVEAARHWAVRTGQSLPSLLLEASEQPVSQFTEATGELRRSLDDWSDDEVREYLPTLVYALNALSDRSEFVSSPSLTNLVGNGLAS
jgi:hypothetical protein